jgi:hypothetical protein
LSRFCAFGFGVCTKSNVCVSFHLKLYRFMSLKRFKRFLYITKENFYAEVIIKYLLSHITIKMYTIYDLVIKHAKLFCKAVFKVNPLSTTSNLI